MDREGILYICKLENISEKGMMPVLKLVSTCAAYYRKRTVGYNRLYAAMGANKDISLLVRCFNTQVPDYNEQLYVVFKKPRTLKAFEQFRVSAIQEIVEEGAIDLTLSKVEELYSVDNDKLQIYETIANGLIEPSDEGPIEFDPIVEK